MARVLLINKDQRNTQQLQEALRAHSHTVHAATSAHAGLQHARTEGADLVLLEINLPDMDGRTVAALLRTHPKLARVPILGITDRQSPNSRRLAQAFGFDDTIAYPINAKTLPMQIDRFLEAD